MILLLCLISLLLMFGVLSLIFIAYKLYEIAEHVKISTETPRNDEITVRADTEDVAEKKRKEALKRAQLNLMTFKSRRRTD